MAWDPVPPGDQDKASRIAGVEVCIWGEFTIGDVQAEGMIAPRIPGIATKG